MALSVSDIWKLLVQSRLLTQEQCQQLSVGFAALPGAATAPGKTLAEWLVRKNVLSKYQAIILLAGRAGPFFYGDYKIYDRIDSGRLAGVFRAVHSGTNHPVMLKFLSGAATQSPQAWAEIQQRIPLTAHPNLNRCYEAVDLGSYKFLVWEDLRGQSLDQVLEKSKRIPADEASRLGRLAALGLARLHESGVTHGDVRPHHFWLEPNGNLKVLMDADTGSRGFNLATAPGEPDGVIRADYAAPEYLQAGRPPDPLVDTYALGCSLYQMISGQPPFAGGDVNTKLQRHATEAIKPLDSVGAPPALTQVIAYAMAKNPAVRFKQVSILAEQLVPFAASAQQNLKASSPPGTLMGYEAWLQQKGTQASPVRAMAAHSAGAGPQAMMPAPIVSTRPSAGGAAAGRPAAGPVVTAGIGAVAAPSKASAVSATMKKRARAKKRNNLIFLTLSLLAVIGAVSVVAYVMNSNTSLVTEKDKKKKEAQDVKFAPPGTGLPATTDPKNPATTAKSPRDANSTSEKQPASSAVVSDDGQTLWNSPTQGQPINLRYVPPGAQLFLVARPAALLESSEGQRVLKALGPQFSAGREAWEKSLGVKLEEVDQVIVALYGNQGKTPKAAYVVRLKSDIDPDQMAAKWGNPTPVDGLEGVLQKGELGFHIPTDNKRTFVAGPLDPEMKEAVAAGWKPPLLRREIGQLLQVSDDQRHLTILFAPNFLFGDGQELFAGDLARAMRPLEEFLGDGLKSGLVSLNLSDNFYFEMRMESDIQTDRFRLASQVRERMAEIPTKIEAYIAELNPHPYWRLVAFRYPSMIRFLHEHTRVGVDGNHAMVNSVLPTQAAHNLIFGAEMVLASTPGVAVASATVGGGKPAAPKTIDDLLNAKLSIGFAQDSLEFSMQNIVTEVKAAYPEIPFDFQIKILGTDLEKDGITRNQQIRDFNQKDKPVQEVLTAMVMKANPVTTVKAPNEVDQKLVWVVAPNPDNPAQQVVLITTRTAAGQKKYTLPEVFRPK